MPKQKVNGLITMLKDEDCYTEQTFFKFTQGDMDTFYKKANLSLAAKRAL